MIPKRFYVPTGFILCLLVGYGVGAAMQPPPEHTVETVTQVVPKEVVREVEVEVPAAMPSQCDDLTAALEDYNGTLGDVTEAAGNIGNLVHSVTTYSNDASKQVPFIMQLNAEIDKIGNAVVAKQEAYTRWESKLERCNMALDTARRSAPTR